MNIKLTKGVSWYEPLHQWRARITVNGKQLLLGYFFNKDLAHHAYKQAAQMYFKEFARI